MSFTATPQHQDHHAGPLDLTDADREARADLLAAVHELHRAGVLPFTSSSNGSTRLPSRDDRILLSARGLRADIGVDDFGVVDLDGNLISGWLDANVQPVVAMHTAVYEAHREVNTVLHTHSTAAASFAVARTPIPVHYEPLLYRGQLHAIPVTEFGTRNRNAELVDRVVDVLRAHPDTKAILLANHGLLAWDSSAEAAAHLVVTIEEAAAIILGAAALGGSKAIPGAG
jgi:ribulose-5-phosphate 4-epimerase/fuculose-1-phosphate aldolase